MTIDDEKVIDADEMRERKKAFGDAALWKGFHHFRLQYFQKEGENFLNLRFGIKNQPPMSFGNSLFY